MEDDKFCVGSITSTVWLAIVEKLGFGQIVDDSTGSTESYEKVKWFIKQEFLKRTKRSSVPTVFWDDPLYPDMWYLVKWFIKQEFLKRTKRSSVPTVFWDDPLYPDMWYLLRVFIEAPVCHSGISPVAVPIVSGLSSNVLCSSALSITSSVSPNPPSSLSLTSLQTPVNSLNLNVPSSSHNPIILPSSASLLIHSINSSNNSTSGIRSVPPITSSSLAINGLGNPNITVPMTCKNEFLCSTITNPTFSYDSVLPVESSTICPNPSFSTIANQTVEVIDPTQNLSSSISGSTPVTLALQSNMLNSNHMHSENVSSFNGECGIRPISNPPLPPCFPLNLMPISPNGDFPAAQINFPGLPPVLLQVLPLPGVKMGEHYTINVPTQLIWDGISSALASGGTVNGGPIILSITPTPLPSHSVSSMSTVPASSYTMTNQTSTPISLCGPSNGFINPTLPQVGVPVSTVIPYSTLSVGPLTTTVTTTSVINTKLPGVNISPLLSNPVSAVGGAKRMRAIAPKPSNVSSVATLGVKPTSASTTISKSGTKRHGLVTAISSVNGIVSNSTSSQSNHASIPNIGAITGVPTPPKLLHSASRKVSLPLVNFSSSFVRSGRGRRRCAVGQQSVSTSFVDYVHTSSAHIAITNSVNSGMGISTDTINLHSQFWSNYFGTTASEPVAFSFWTGSTFISFCSSLYVGRGRRRCAVGQQSVSTTFVTSAHASPICITNSVNSGMGISTDTSNVCSLQTPVSLPLSSQSSLSSFYSTPPILVPPTTNPGPVLPPGPIPPTFLFGNPLHNAPPITMPNGVAPFLFQPPLPISNSCSQFPNSVFSPVTCTVSISPSTSCPLAVVRSLPSVSSANIFAANNGPTMASLDPATGLLTYYPSSCIPMNNPYPPTLSSSDSPSINISTVCSQPNQTMGIQPSSQSGPVMYPFQTQHLLSNQIVPTIFPNIPTDIAGANTFTDHTAFLQSFAPSLMDSSCISSNVHISSESTIVQSQMACQNAFLTSAGNFHSNGNSGNIPIFPSLPVSSIALPSLEVSTSICETNGIVEDDACLAKDDLISLAWHLTQMEDDFETHEKQNPDVLINQTDDENNGMFEDFLQVYSQNATAFNFNTDLGCQTHILNPSSVNPDSDVLDKDVILLDSEPEYRTDFENRDDGTQLSCPNEESTGNADIDALLAAAAMVGAASGVGDAQSAVAVPLPSSSLASVTHQNTLSSECDSSHPENKDDVHGDIHVTFSSSLLPAHSTSCKLSPLLDPINVGDSVNGLKETKPDDLLPKLYDELYLNPYQYRMYVRNPLISSELWSPHMHWLSLANGELSNVPNPPVSPEFECHLPPLVLATGASLFPESCLHSDACSSDDSYSTIPSVRKFKVEPDETAVVKASHDEDIVSSSTPTKLHTQESHKRKKRGRHITGIKPHAKTQVDLSTVTERHTNHSRFDFDKNNFIGVNPNFLKPFESLGEAPFERFLHDTKLQTFATLKSCTGETVRSLKSNFNSWCEPNQNVLLFSKQCNEQSTSGDCDSVSTQNLESENHFNDTRSTTEEVPESSSILSSETNGNNHIFDEPVSTSYESSKSSIASHQLVFSTPVSHTFSALPTLASFCSLPKSHSPFQSHILSLPITTAVNQSNSLCDSSSSHSLEKVFPTVSPLPVNRNAGIAGSFAGAAAFRATSFSALAAKVEKKNVGNEFHLNNTSETLWRNVTFADLAKFASSECKSKEVSQTPNIATSLSCNSSWFIDKSMQIDASALQPKPLFQPNLPHLTSSKSAENSTLLPATIFSSPRASPNHFSNQLPFNDVSKSSKSSPSKSNVSETLKKRLKRIPSLPRKTNRRKRSAGKRQRRPCTSLRKSTTEVLLHNSDNFYTEGNNSVPSIDDISNHFVTTVNNETQHHYSDSEKPSVDECNKSEKILSSPICLKLESTNAPSDFSVIGHSTSPTIIMTNSSVISNAGAVVVDNADKDNGNHIPSASPSVQLTSVNCEQSISVSAGIEDNLSCSEVVSSVDEGGTDPIYRFVGVHSENTASKNSLQSDVLQDKNVGSLFPDSTSENIMTDNDKLLSHPPIRLRLNLKLAALKSKSKKKKRKKLHINDPVMETKSNPVVEMVDDPSNCSLSIRLVNKVPVVKEISKSNSNNSSRKRKKNEKTSIHCKGHRNLTIIMDSNLQCRNPPKSSRLHEASSVTHNVHITQSTQAYSLSSVLPSGTVKNIPVHSLSTKKIFSTARQERRSNYAQLTRPWRANLSTSPRKRNTASFRSVSARRHVANVARPRSHLISACSDASLANSKQLNISCARSIIPENVFSKKASNNDVDNCCDNSQSYSITNLTGVHKEIPKIDRPESHPLRLVIRLGKPVNGSKDELVCQSVVSPLNVQVPSDMSSNSSQASNDVDHLDENASLSILPEEFNVKNDSSVQELTGFCVASEAETFMDPNQFQIHRILNRALPMSSGLVGLYIPSPSEDDDNGDGCGMVEKVFDSEHRLRMTDQSFHFSQVCHENATPVAPQIGCTAGLSSRKKIKPLKGHRRNKRDIKSTRYRCGRLKNTSTDERNLDHSSRLRAQCIKSFEKHSVLDINTDLDFLHGQPLTCA
ncbi:uncharacterized protein DC041_0012574 [Schistosoma bovis]|uniref:Uncharacterized protein n=1 Tax=Schistosoma bovis TaxID=6184 RepID=A0A430Q9A6_SCHBO|nr:uncharacterized protein DC041_0012574 [Schistosoma bovis]